MQVTHKELYEISSKYHMAVTLDETGRPRAVSLLSQCAVKLGLRSDVHFYGNNQSDFMEHIRFHANYLLKTSSQAVVGFVVHFPRCLQADKVEGMLESRIGARWKIIDSELWLIETEV